MVDIKEEQIMANVEFETVTAIVTVLKPVKLDLEKLCSRNAIFLTAEGVFSFVNGELNEQNSEFVKNMKYSLIQRINEISVMASRRVHYDANMKKKEILYPKNNGNRSVARKFDTNETNIRHWRKQRDMIFAYKSSTKSFSD
ncbi:uncharacterized protein TNCV_2315241 [Trichonephila clavipes]|nr:uncharacterized protein TNCV_2315241 [Trichonephila clavipes]